MAYVSKARDLQGSSMTGATIRLAQRESFDARKAVQPPSATGGAPRVATQTTTLPAPQAPTIPAPTQTAADAYRVRAREGSNGAPIIPFLLKSRRSIEEYNEQAPGFAERLAQEFVGAGVAVAGMDATELAQRTVAAINRYADPISTSTALPDLLYQNRNGRRIMRMLDQIRAQRAAR